MFIRISLSHSYFSKFLMAIYNIPHTYKQTKSRKLKHAISFGFDTNRNILWFDVGGGMQRSTIDIGMSQCAHTHTHIK